MDRTEFSGLKEDLNWFTLVYEGKSTLKVGGSGTGGLQELAEQFKDDEAMFGFLKVGAEDRKAVTSVRKLVLRCKEDQSHAPAPLLIFNLFLFQCI